MGCFALNLDRAFIYVLLRSKVCHHGFGSIGAEGSEKNGKGEKDLKPLALVSNWPLTFQLCQISPQPFNFVSKWSLSLSVE
jgi:hypothetical protein